MGLPDAESVLLLLHEAAERMQRLRSRGGLCPLFSLFVSLQASEDPRAAPSSAPTSHPGFALGDLQGSKLAPASLKSLSMSVFLQEEAAFPR